MFIVFIEANIAGEMIKCRKAINEKDWESMKTVVQSIAAKGRRLTEVGRATLESIHDPSKKAEVTEALSDLDKSIF